MPDDKGWYSYDKCQMIELMKVLTSSEVTKVFFSPCSLRAPPARGGAAVIRIVRRYDDIFLEMMMMSSQWSLLRSWGCWWWSYQVAILSFWKQQSEAVQWKPFFLQIQIAGLICLRGRELLWSGCLVMGNVVTYQVISAGNESWIYRCQVSGLITTIPHVTLCAPPPHFGLK